MKYRVIFTSTFLFFFRIYFIFSSDLETTLKTMTLEEKIGQIMAVEEESIRTNRNDVIKYNIGALFTEESDYPVPNTPDNWKKMIDEYQNLALKTRLKIPLLFGAHIFHGNNKIKNSVIFPHNIGLGATQDPELIRKIGEITARETISTGINWAFLPTLSIPEDERWGHFYECYSENSEIVKMLFNSFLSGLQGEHLSNRNSVLACVRGYLGEGAIKGGKENGNIEISEEEMRKNHLPLFKEAIRNNARCIMVSYASYNGEKLHKSYYWITKVLKGELGFDGFVISEQNGFNSLEGDYEKQIALAMNAGIDMFMISGDYRKFFESVKRLIKEKKVSVERLNDAVRRILKVKQEMKLMEKVKYNYVNERKNIGRIEHRNVAREAVRKSVVVLKNNGILPLTNNYRRILVAGKNANDVGNQCGGYTIYFHGSWQKWLHQTNGIITKGTTILRAVSNYFTNSIIIYEREPKELKKNEYDLAIAVIGERPYGGKLGYRKLLTLDYEDWLNPDLFVLDYRDTRVIRKIKKAKIPLITILITGRPLIINNILKKSDAFLVAWFFGTEADGVIDIITGKYKPAGKLPVSWPRSMNDVPKSYLDKNYKPLFPIGFFQEYH